MDRAWIRRRNDFESRHYKDLEAVTGEALDAATQMADEPNEQRRFHGHSDTMHERRGKKIV